MCSRRFAVGQCVFVDANERWPPAEETMPTFAWGEACAEAEYTQDTKYTEEKSGAEKKGGGKVIVTVCNTQGQQMMELDAMDIDKFEENAFNQKIPDTNFHKATLINVTPVNRLINEAWIDVLEQLRDQIVQYNRLQTMLLSKKIEFFGANSDSYETQLANECLDEQKRLIEECAVFDNNKTSIDYYTLQKRYFEIMPKIQEVEQSTPDIQCRKKLTLKITSILTDSQQQKQLATDPSKQEEMDKLTTDLDTLTKEYIAFMCALHQKIETKLDTKDVIYDDLVSEIVYDNKEDVKAFLSELSIIDKTKGDCVNIESIQALTQLCKEEQELMIKEDKLRATIKEKIHNSGWFDEIEIKTFSKIAALSAEDCNAYLTGIVLPLFLKSNFRYQLTNGQCIVTEVGNKIKMTAT